MKVAYAGAFANRLVEPVRARLRGELPLNRIELPAGRR